MTMMGGYIAWNAWFHKVQRRSAALTGNFCTRFCGFESSACYSTDIKCSIKSSAKHSNSLIVRFFFLAADSRSFPLNLVRSGVACATSATDVATYRARIAPFLARQSPLPVPTRKSCCMFSRRNVVICSLLWKSSNEKPNASVSSSSESKPDDFGFQKRGTQIVFHWEW